MLRQLAEEVRNGNVDIGTAITRLRAENKPLLTRLADWIEARPTNAMLASALIGVAASLLGPQIPVMTDGDVDEPQRGYTDEEVQVIIETILEHYDETQQSPPKRGNRTAGSD